MQIKNMFKDRFAANVTKLAGGTALGQGLAVLFAPLLTRLYGPQDFGLLGVFAAVLGITSVASAFRYELAIPLPEKEEDGATLLVVALAMVCCVSLLCALLLLGFNAPFAALIGSPALAPYLWLLPPGLLILGSYQSFNYWAIRQQRFTTLALTKVNQGASMVLVQSLFGAFGVAPFGLLAGQVVGQAAGCGTLVRQACKHDRQIFSRISAARLKQCAVRYRRFPLFSTGSALLNSMGGQLPVIFVASLFGVEIAGAFALVQRVIGMPVGVIGRSVSQVYFSQSARLIKTDPAAVKSLFVKTALRLFIIGLLPALLLFFIGPWTFTLVFGKAWTLAGLYARSLALMMLLQFVAVPLSQTLNIVERQELQLFWDCLRFGLVLAVFAAAKYFSLDDLCVIMVYSGLMAISYVILFAMSYLNICKVISRSGVEHV